MNLLIFLIQSDFLKFSYFFEKTFGEMNLKLHI